MSKSATRFSFRVGFPLAASFSYHVGLTAAFATADHLVSDAVRTVKRSASRTVFGYSARLCDIRHRYTWNAGFPFDAVKACGDLLFLLSFSSDARQALHYDSEVANDDGLILNGFGVNLREQLATVLAALGDNLRTTTAVLSPWQGIESQQLGYFEPTDKTLRPNDLLTMQFYFGGKSLHAVCNFRTMDALSLPYEIFTWGSLLSLVAGFVGIPAGVLEINATEIHLRDHAASSLAEQSPALQSAVKIDDGALRQSSESAIVTLESAAVQEEVMRRGLEFRSHRDDIGRMIPFTTLTTCLAVAYLRCAKSAAAELQPSQRLALDLLGGAGRLVDALTSVCDRRLLERAAASLWPSD